jgi:hypothetical protein
MPGPTLIARGNVSLEMIMQVSLNPNNGTNIPANTSVETTYTLQGVNVGDFLEINKPSHTTGICVGNIRVPANNQVAVQFMNVTAAPIAPTTEAYLIALTRYELGVNPPSALVP